MFSEMRAAFHLQRWTAHMAKAQNEPNVPAPLSVRDMLEFATICGAGNAALAAKIGSLTPGKEADLVVIRAEDVNTMPLTNAVATVVQYAHAGNVEAVFVAGNVRKWRGALVGHDMASVRRRIHKSRDELFERRGMKLDVLA
jgi:cytosine/adenosine deaminase-related metal-dependent hydrolase